MKRIKGSTLMETVIATVIIIVVFAVSSLILNTIARKLYKNKAFIIENHIEKIQYTYNHKKLELPYEETVNGYEIYVNREKMGSVFYVRYEATSETNDHTIIKYFVADE